MQYCNAPKGVQLRSKLGDDVSSKLTTEFSNLLPPVTIVIKDYSVWISCHHSSSP